MIEEGLSIFGDTQRKIVELMALEFLLEFHKANLGRQWHDMVPEMTARIEELRSGLGATRIE